MTFVIGSQRVSSLIFVIGAMQVSVSAYFIFKQEIFFKENFTSLKNTLIVLNEIYLVML